MLELFGFAWVTITFTCCVAAVSTRRSVLRWLKARTDRKRLDDTVEIVRRPQQTFASYAALVVLALPAGVMAGGSALPGPGAACLACGNAALRGPNQMRARGLHRSSYVFAMVGNSLTTGLRETTPWPTKLSTMLTGSGTSFTLSNLGHGGYATEFLSDRPNYSLTYKIPTEVDPLWDASKNNVLVLQEVINDLYYGATGAEAYANVRTYFQTTAKQWDYRVVVAPTPRDNPGTPVGYEAARQDFITLMAADPTFGGWVDAVWRVDQDARLGDAADSANAYYYYISGGADTKVHWVDNAGHIAASAIMRILTSAKPSHFPFHPRNAPYPAAYFSAATSGSALVSSGGVATDGQTVETWVHDGSLVSGNLGRNSGAPLYETSGFGSQPSIVMAATSRLASVNSLAHGQGTMVLTFKASSPGIALFTIAGGGDIRLYAANDGDAFDFTSLHAFGANYNSRALTADISDNAGHVLSLVYTGTSSGHSVNLDGAAAAGTDTNSGEPGSTAFSGALNVGHPTTSFVGEIGEVFVSPIPFNTVERAELTTYLCSRRAVTCS